MSQEYQRRAGEVVRVDERSGDVHVRVQGPDEEVITIHSTAIVGGSTARSLHSGDHVVVSFAENKPVSARLSA